MFCLHCGFPIPQERSYAPPVKRTSRLYTLLSLLVAVVGFIGGFVLGIMYAIPEIKSTGEVEKHFNFPIMIFIWIGTLILFFLFFGIYRILENQETILHHTDR